MEPSQIPRLSLSLFKNLVCGVVFNIFLRNILPLNGIKWHTLLVHFFLLGDQILKLTLMCIINKN